MNLTTVVKQKNLYEHIRSNYTVSREELKVYKRPNYMDGKKKGGLNDRSFFSNSNKSFEHEVHFVLHSKRSNHRFELSSPSKLFVLRSYDKRFRNIKYEELQNMLMLIRRTGRIESIPFLARSSGKSGIQYSTQWDLNGYVLSVDLSRMD